VSKKLFVGNLSFKAIEEDVKNLFSSYGSVEEVKIITDRESGKSRGFAFVTLSKVEDADKATAELHNKDFQGRPLKISEARERERKSGSSSSPA